MDECRAEGDAYAYAFDALKEYLKHTGCLAGLVHDIEKMEFARRSWFFDKWPSGLYEAISSTGQTRATNLDDPAVQSERIEENPLLQKFVFSQPELEALYESIGRSLALASHGGRCVAGAVMLRARQPYRVGTWA